tara:strand:+ start:2229 stop:2903 length:675 start_codon:yes stop_codon:yes gene_type:complete
MFELNNDLEIKVARVCGRSLVVVDNFYKNPDVVRQLCIDNIDNVGAPGHLPGKRICVKTSEVKDKLYDFYFGLCSDHNLWNRELNGINFYQEWNKVGFNVNIISDDSIDEDRHGLIPHQDTYYPSTNPNVQFGSVIYLNKPEECAGGTNVYTYQDEISIPKIPFVLNPDSITQFIENNPEWKVAHTFEMVYNRMVLYQSDILHGPIYEQGMFTDHNRMNQILFM